MDLSGLHICCIAERNLQNFLEAYKDGPFNNTVVKGLLSMGSGTERLEVSPIALQLTFSALPKLLLSLAEGRITSMKDQQLCADVAVALMSCLSASCTDVIIDRIYQQMPNQRNSILEIVLENQPHICIKVVDPLDFKLKLARGFLKIPLFCTSTVMGILIRPIASTCYQYSSHTGLAFRTLDMWLMRWQKSHFGLKNNNCQSIYTIIVDNWENPIPGIRKEIFKIFDSLLCIARPTTNFAVKKLMLHVINELSPRMKSKYFLLTIILPKYGVTQALKEFPCIVPDLVNSLRSVQLMSAATDVYQVCLTGFKGIEDWCYFFLEPVMTIFTSQRKEDRLVKLNLISRWLNQTLRRFPALTHVLLNYLTMENSSNCEAHFALSAVLHYGRKEGYLTDIEPEYTFFEQCLDDSDEEIRKHVFAAVCKKSKKTTVPSFKEFEAVKQFLKENVNADSCTLRQSLLNSFSHFVERLYVSSVKLTSKTKENGWILHMPSLTFLNWLHKFLLKNLNSGGNYQRKVTSLQLLLEVIKWFGPREIKSSSEIVYIRTYAKEHNIWHFDSEETWLAVVNSILCPSEDIQKIAGNILAKHLQLLDDDDDDDDDDNKNGVLSRAMKLWGLVLSQSRSPLFYEAESGLVLMRLFVQFFSERPGLSDIISSSSSSSSSSSNIKQGREMYGVIAAVSAFHESTQSAIENNGMRMLVAFWQRELLCQWSSWQEGLLPGVTPSGTGLHGVLAAFSALVPHMAEGDITALSLTLDDIVEKILDMLSGESCTTVSPSFADTAQAIDRLLPDEEVEAFATHLSPAHQLVFSCVWLTLKQSCAVASDLVCHRSASTLDAKQCLYLAEKVLMRTRHKGSIEAAGASLAVMVRHITSKANGEEWGNKLCKFLEEMLLNVLQGIAIYSQQISITRRSAGVSILVQKIVSADARPQKPLLMMCLSNLYKIVQKSQIPVVQSIEEYDLPQARALHLLSRLAQDAALRLGMLPQATDAAFLCFQAFSSPLWTVRNAALQYFGVILPMLIGEKKVHDDDMESYGNSTTEEFVSHYTTLLIFFLKEIEKHVIHQRRSKHIIPILSLLSKLTYGDIWSLNNKTPRMKNLQNYFYLLLKDSDLVVRTLAAKCYSRTIHRNVLQKTVLKLLNKLKKTPTMPQNVMHSYMKTLKLLIFRLIEEKMRVGTLKYFERKFQKLNLNNALWITKTTAFDISCLLHEQCSDNIEQSTLEFIKDVLHQLELNSSSCNTRGINAWAVNCVKHASTVCLESEIKTLWTILLQSNQDSLIKVYICGIQNRLPSLTDHVKEEIVNTLVPCINNELIKDWDLLTCIYSTLLELVPYIKNTSSFEVISTAFENAKKQCNIKCWSVALPLFSEMFSPYIRNFSYISQEHKLFLKTLAIEIRKRSLVDDCNVESRVHGARAFLALFREFSSLYVCNKEAENDPAYTDIVIVILDSEIAFLQDEDPDVRKEASRCILPEKNPYCCLNTLLSIHGLRRVLNDFHITRYLFSKLQDLSSLEDVLVRFTKHKDTLVGCSPFSCYCSNIYAEEVHVLQKVGHSLLALLGMEPPSTYLLPDPCYDVCEKMVTQLVQTWRNTTYGGSILSFHMNMMILRLQLLAKVCEIISMDSLALHFTNLASFISSVLEEC